MSITAIVILERCRRADEDRRRLQERIRMYRDGIGRVTASLDGIGSRSTGERDPMAAIIGEIDAAERRAGQREREYVAELNAACQLIDRLPALEGTILRRYYLQREDLRAISRDMGYSYGYVRSRKSAGCSALREVPEARVRALLPDWYLDGEKRRR